MKRTVMSIFGMLAVIAMSVPAFAHFQMIYTPEIALEKGKAIDFSMVFTHPFEAGHTMDMGTPEEFYVIAQRGGEGKPKKTDLKEFLKSITWVSTTNSGKAFEASLPKKIVRSLGDYTFVLNPAPYYESEEDIYIQQITKTVLNVGGLPGNWDAPIGLPTEILALDKPYANWVGGVFRGVVLSEGKPVPNAEIEIEYLNHSVDMKGRKFSEKGFVEAPQDSFVTMGIRANDRGEFTIGLPKAGWWGICALGVGPATEYKGKELSQDAVLWVKAVDMK